MTYGEEVRAAINTKGLTLQRVGDRCGTFKGYISGICTGNLNPPSERMTRKLSRVLGLNVDRMLGLAVLQKRKSASLEGLRALCDEMIDAQSKSGAEAAEFAGKAGV